VRNAAIMRAWGGPPPTAGKGEPHLTRFLDVMRGAFTAAPISELPVMKMPLRSPPHPAIPRQSRAWAQRVDVLGATLPAGGVHPLWAVSPRVSRQRLGGWRHSQRCAALPLVLIHVSPTTTRKLLNAQP
jgi:hypothetical protein